MIRGFLNRLRGGQKTAEGSRGREKLFFDERPDYVYAIGDVHGCLRQLEAVERKILADAEALPGRKMLVMLGDYVDRGPHSAAVLDRLSGSSLASVERICLAGNHEEVMLEFLANPSASHRWLDFGGIETLHSYGIYEIPTNRAKFQLLLRSHIPDEHIDFLTKLPSLAAMPDYCFVHAGIDEGRPLAEQDDTVLLWKRPGKTMAIQAAMTIVHGHTVVGAAEHRGNRINIDTGAYMSGVLSAVRISQGGDVVFMRCD